MEDDVLLPGSGDVPPAVTPPASAAPPPAPAAAPKGEATPEPFKPAYESQLSKRLQNPETYEKLALVGGPNIDHLADAYLAAVEKNRQSEGRLYIPGADAKPEDWTPVWAALGRPETVEGYKLDRSGELAGLPVVPELEAFYKETFLKNNLPAGVAESLWRDLSVKSLSLMNAAKAQREADTAQGLKDFETLAGRDGIRQKAELELVAKTLFGEEEWGALMEARTKSGKILGNNAPFLLKLASLRQYMTDSSVITGGGALGKTTPKTASEAVAQALE